MLRTGRGFAGVSFVAQEHRSLGLNCWDVECCRRSRQDLRSRMRLLKWNVAEVVWCLVAGYHRGCRWVLLGM